MAFPAELMILMRQCPNSSRIKRSASADGWWVCSAFLACSSRHSHVASSTSFVTNVYGNLKGDRDSQLQLYFSTSVEKSVLVPPSSTRDNGCSSGEQIWDLWRQFGFGCRLLLHSDFCCISQVHQGLPLWALLKVLAANALTDWRAHDLCLCEVGEHMRANVNVIFCFFKWRLDRKSSWNPPRNTRSSSSDSPTVCSCSLCCVGGLTRPLCPFRFLVWRPLDSDLGRSAIKQGFHTCPSDRKRLQHQGLRQPHLYRFETFRFVFQVIEAVIAVAVVAELSVCKAVTVSVKRANFYLAKGKLRSQQEKKPQQNSQFEALWFGAVARFPWSRCSFCCRCSRRQ